jgi:aminobenzoyl-glutamate utilization protein B
MDKKALAVYIDGIAGMLADVSDRIWDYAETAFEEHKSAALLKKALADAGFAVKDSEGGIDTAFSASFGHGKPVIGILGEYDALSGLSQKPGSLRQEKRGGDDNGNGHGCGHNMFGAGSLGAALAVKKYIEGNALAGTVKYFGCPGEEGGSGKAFMAREGVFAGLDAVFAWHPMAVNAVMNMRFLANYQVHYKFRGRAAHAASAPHLGRSALDAVELMNVGVNFLREHVIQEARIHYAITDSGGFSPNVVQPAANVLYLIRAPTMPLVEDIYMRVNKIAEGAAMMTETDVEIDFIKACADVVPNRTLSRLLHANFTALGLPVYTDAEHRFASGIAKDSGRTPGSELSMFVDMSRESAKEQAKRLADRTFCDITLPYDADAPEPLLAASSDVGDVSWHAPTAQMAVACYALGTMEHSWQLVAQGKSAPAHKGLVLAAKAIAGACADVLDDPRIAEEARRELDGRLGGQPYRSAIPPEVLPRAIGRL